MRYFAPVATALLLALAAPAYADDDMGLPDDGGAPAASTGIDPSALKSQLGGLEGQLKGQQAQGSGGPSIGHLMHVVQALKNGGKGVTAEDISQLRGYLAKMGQDSSTPELTPALDMLGQQLEALQHQMANPDEDPLKQLGLDQ